MKENKLGQNSKDQQLQIVSPRSRRQVLASIGTVTVGFLTGCNLPRNPALPTVTPEILTPEEQRIQNFIDRMNAVATNLQYVQAFDAIQLVQAEQDFDRTGETLKILKELAKKNPGLLSPDYENLANIAYAAARNKKTAQDADFIFKELKDNAQYYLLSKHAADLTCLALKSGKDTVELTGLHALLAEKLKDQYVEFDSLSMLTAAALLEGLDKTVEDFININNALNNSVDASAILLQTKIQSKRTVAQTLDAHKFMAEYTFNDQFEKMYVSDISRAGLTFASLMSTQSGNEIVDMFLRAKKNNIANSGDAVRMVIASVAARNNVPVISRRETYNREIIAVPLLL